MEKRSRRRARDLVTRPAFQGLSENEIGCVRISMMARSQTAPFKGRIQKRKTKRLHSSHLACNTRPVHTDGSFARFCHIFRMSDYPPIASRSATAKISRPGKNPQRCRLCIQLLPKWHLLEISLRANIDRSANPLTKSATCKRRRAAHAARPENVSYFCSMPSTPMSRKSEAYLLPALSHHF